MPEWELRSQYDYRFGTIMLQAMYNGAPSPTYQIPLREVLKQVPRHEVMACLQMSEDASLPPDGDIEKYRRVAIREANCEGKVVLDIGGYDGWAAKLALECGASRAICLDNHQYEHYGWEEKKLDGVEYVNADLMKLGVASDRKYGSMEYGSLYRCFYSPKNYSESWPPPDIIINYNVLYHTKNPWAFLDRCQDILKPDGLMLLCTIFRYHDGPWAYLYEPKECNPTDETVYWGFSLSALERLLRQTGWDFELVGLSYDRVVYRCSPIPGFERRHQDT